MGIGKVGRRRVSGREALSVVAKPRGASWSAAALRRFSSFLRMGRIHQPLHITAVMKTGVSAHVWSLEEIVCLLS
jgi:hypothetical protein